MTTNMFKDETGKTSAIRVMSMVALVASIWFGWMTISMEKHGGQLPQAGIYITSMFAVAAFAPKVMQKFAEKAERPN